MARPEIPLRRPMAWMFDRLVAAYQRWISPLTPPACRFHPSCSVYARDALALHPLWRALGLTTWRLLRCQPFSKGGHDPVPTKPHGPASLALSHSHPSAVEHSHPGACSARDPATFPSPPQADEAHT